MEWDPDRFLEWWEAGLKFRRTRSYGCLLSIAALYWRMTIRQEREKLLEAIEADPALSMTAWRKLPKKVREDLEPELLPKDEPLGDVVWIGRVEWCIRSRAYKVHRPAVDLIPDDKSISASPRSGAPPPLYQVEADRRRSVDAPYQHRLSIF